MQGHFLTTSLICFIALISMNAFGGEAADAQAKIKAAVIQAAPKGGNVQFYVDLFGAPTRAKLVDANDAEITVEAMGQPIGIAWEGISPKRLAGLAKALPNMPGEFHLTIAEYCMANELPEDADAEIAEAVKLDAGLADRAAKLTAILHPPAPEVQKPQPKEVSKPATPTALPTMPPITGVPAAPKFAFGWEPIGISGGGALYTPAISPLVPGLMMINCDMSPAFISKDGGRSWRMIHYSQLGGNTRLYPAFHPTDPNVIFSAEWNDIKVSKDQGEHWQTLCSVPGGPRGHIYIDQTNPNIMLVGTGDGVALSTNGGGAFKACNGPKGTNVGFHVDQTTPPTQRVMFAGTNQGIWRSDDGGTTWAEKTTGLPSKAVRSFCGGSDAKKNLVILYCAVPSRNEGGKLIGGVYRSMDKGEHWEPAMGQGINVETKSADQYAESQIAEYNFVLATDVNPYIVYTMNSSTGFWPPHHPTVFRSDDAGNTWRATLFLDPRFKSEYNCEPGFQEGTMAQSYQEGASGAAINPANPDQVMRVGGMLCWITANGGKTWYPGNTNKNPQTPLGPDCSFICNGLVVTSTWNYYIDPHDANRHYICYTDIGFARTIDAGRSWIWWAQDRRAPWANTTYELVFDPDIPGKVWGAFSEAHDIPNNNVIGGRHWNNTPERAGGGVCVSTDYATHWKPTCSGLPTVPCMSVALDPKSSRGARTLYASMLENGVYKSTDDGATWTKKSNGLGAPGTNMRVCKVVVHADGTLFCIVTGKRRSTGGPFYKEGAGLYRSKDAGENWECITKSVNLLWPKDFSVHPTDSKYIYIGAARAGDSSEGLYRTRDGGLNWQKVAEKGTEHFGAYFHPKRPGWVYMTLCEGPPGSGLWLSRNDGDAWEPIEGLPFSNIQRVTVDPANPDLIYVTSFGGSVWKGPAAEK